jgi:hypothetical protein
MGQLNTLANDARRRRDWTAREAIMAERKVLADALRQGKLFVLAVRVEEWQRRRVEANNLAMKMSNETFSQVLPGRAEHTRLQLARYYYQPENQNRTTFLEATKTKVGEVEKDSKGWSESVRIRRFKQSEEATACKEAGKRLAD